VRVGVTGSSGLIGSALAAALHERGDEVVRFVRPDSPDTDDRIIRWDPDLHFIDEGDLARVEHFDALVNLAGVGIGDDRWSPSRKRDILSSRINATALMVEALLTMSSKPAIVASGSAVGVYGSRDDDLLDESSFPGDDFLAEVCLEWEKATLPLEEAGIAVAHLRTGIVMSTRGGALKRQLPLFRAGLGARLSNGRQWLSPISLHDEVRAILWILDQRLTGPINLVSPMPVRNKDFTKTLGEALHRPALLWVPAKVLKIALGKELTTGAVLASQRVIPMALLKSGFHFDNPGSSSILRGALRGDE
jgi:uncharacterized protein (TIGR01777 family)